MFDCWERTLEHGKKIMTSLGTWQWAQETGGVIDASDRAELGRRLGSLLEAAARPAPDVPLALNLAEVEPPESALCRSAAELWSDVAPKWLEGHGYRTWYFARVLQELDGLDADPELLFVSCLLHDLGLTGHAAPTESQPCFAVSGGVAAAEVVAPHRPKADAELVGEAIAMHLNVDIAIDEGAVHYLVAAGTLVDVTGVRLALMPPALVKSVLGRHPRGSFGPSVGEALTSMGESFPNTRPGYMHTELGVGQLCLGHALDSTD